MGFGDFAELLILAIGLSMDALAVSICKGLAMKGAGLRQGAICGLWFGGFQALMPLIGFLLGSTFAAYIRSFDYWIAFVLLGIIGFNMVRDALGKDDQCSNCSADLSFRTMLGMAVATSIDALAVGVQLSVQQANIWVAVGLIGAVTFVLCTLGVRLGNLLGCRYEKRAQLAGGAILIGLGLKFLVEGLVENFL